LIHLEPQNSIRQERAYVLSVFKNTGSTRERSGDGHPLKSQLSWKLEESVGLAKAFCLDVVQATSCFIRKESPKFFIGQGWAEKVQETVRALDIAVVVLDGKISSVQQKNLEKFWKCRVLDRVALILGIFGLRAQTAEGRLQVRLAQLQYQKSRLVGFWSHLERQRSGGGFLGGPGEKQKELDRRMLVDQITRLEKQLEKVRKKRHLQRGERQRKPFPVVGLVGYTNAGKSTLFNQLTQSSVLAQDALFATLDPKMKQLRLPSGRSVILSDTVGFISQLPTMLVAAFRSTLEEVLHAEVLLHVQDISSPDWEKRRTEVEKILKEIGFSKWDKVINVYNKVDRLDKGQHESLLEKISTQACIQEDNGNQSPGSQTEDPRSKNISCHLPPKSDKTGGFLQKTQMTNNRHSPCLSSHTPLLLSATENLGLTKLLERLDDFFRRCDYGLKVSFSLDHGEVIHWCYKHGYVVKEEVSDNFMHIEMYLSRTLYEDLHKKYPFCSIMVLQEPTQDFPENEEGWS
jgi:GTP-binding protein HflX